MRHGLRTALACTAAFGAVALFARAGDSPDFDDVVVRAMEPTDLAGTLAAHNAVRAAVVTPTPLPPLQWSPELAETAQRWTQRCTDDEPPAGLIDHNPGRAEGHPWRVGENIYASTRKPDGETAIASWAKEARHYDHGANRCASGRACGHYTQLVWRATTLVGCARADCRAHAYRHAIVCNYAPAGNNGRRPY
jgi:pathogenesis-related protein 1